MRPFPPSPPLSGRQAQPLWIVQLRGSQEQMGRQHGELLRGAGGWQETLDFYPTLLDRFYRAASAPNRVRIRAALRPVIQHLQRRLERDRSANELARSQAFMVALGRPKSHSRRLLVMDIFQNIIGVAGRLRLGPFSRRVADAGMAACSSAAIWGVASAGGVLRHARNFDFPGAGMWDRRPAVVFCSPTDGLRYGFVTTRGADVPGAVTAFNEAGLTLTTHTRLHRDVTFSGACIDDLGHGIIREARTLRQAVAIARRRPVASSWGLLISSAKERRAVSIETTSRKVRVITPDADEAFLWCANRYRDAELRAGELTPSPHWLLQTLGRQETMQRQLSTARRWQGDDLIAMLSGHLDPRAHSFDSARERAAGGTLAQSITVQTIVAEPEAQQITVSCGRAPTSKGPWHTIPWTWSDAPSASLWPQPPRHLAGDSSYDRGVAMRAYECFVEASRLDGLMRPDSEVSRAIEEAVRLSGQESSYRLLAGGMALRARDWPRAAEHFVRGATTETIAIKRAELLLWGSRAMLHMGDRRRGRRLRDQLLATSAEHLEGHRRQARRDRLRPWSARQATKLVVDFQMLAIHT